MNERELYTRLQPYLNTYQGGKLGTSYLDQFNNAKLAQGELDSLVANNELTKDDQLYKVWNSNLGAQRQGAIAGGALSIANGLGNIWNSVKSLSDIEDTSAYDQQIYDIGNIGTAGYGSYGQLQDDYQRLADSNFSVNYDDIRGADTGQMIGDTLSATMAGASAGFSVGSGWGALAGGIIGLGAGIGGIIAGNMKAKKEQARLKNDALLATNSARRNLASAGEGVRRYNFRSGVAHSAAQGGQIERKQLTMQEFADRILNRQRRSDVTHSARLVTQRCKGGVIVRLK